MGLSYRTVSSPQPTISYLVTAIGSRLKDGQRVLWLVPGGSGMDIAVAVAVKLRPSPHLKNLAISLTDERFGPVGHPDSNWRQLIDKGFTLPGARLLPVLSDSKNLQSAARSYERLLDKELRDCDYSIALAGMGADGHILGIKPGSPALSSAAGVTAYEWTDFIRLTPTAKIIARIDEIVVYAVGWEKWPQLRQHGEKLNPSQQPAQLLKAAAKVIVYSDWQENK